MSTDSYLRITYTNSFKVRSTPRKDKAVNLTAEPDRISGGEETSCSYW
jgi:hypothetical protein